MLERDFCLVLHAKLKEVVKGKVFTRVEDDILIVSIDMDELHFEMHYNDFVNRVMLYGLTSDYIVCEVTEKYRKFLTNRLEYYYFKKKEAVV